MSNRRQTLGVLSNRRHTTFEAGLRQPVKTTTTRSRQSMAPTVSAAAQKRRQTLATSTRPSFGAGPGARKSVGAGRKSMGGGRRSLGHRQSIMAPNKGKHADPRPIKKKAYMEQEIREVIRFLCHHNYDHPITPKQLSKPTAKDFENIVLFLFSVVDNHYTFSGNIKQDVPLFYKGLGYPFTLSPAALCAVGAPNTWPSMLAAVSWLIELLSYDDVVSASEDNENDIDGEQADKRFFRFLSASYTAFLSGADAEFEDLSREMEEYFDARNKVIADEASAAESKALMLQDELKSLTEAESMIPSLREEVSVLESDISKHKTYMAELEAYKDKKKADVIEARNALKTKETHLHELQQKHQRLKHTIANQAFSVQEFQSMCKERSRKRKALQAAQKDKDAAQAEIWDIEARRAGQVDELEQLTKEYNSFATQLQLCPAEAKYADGEDYNVQLRVFDSDQAPLSLDMKGFVKPKVKSLVQTVTMDAVEVGKESLKLSERIAELQEKHDEIKATNKSLKATLDRQENALAEEKARLAAGADALQKKIDDLRIATTKLASSDVCQRKEILAQREQLQQLQQQQQQAAEAARAEEEALYREIHRTAQLVAGHEEVQQAALKTFSAKLSQSIQSIS